jgi:hypothetical protein
MFREEMVASMEEIFVAFRHMQQENQTFRDYVVHLQNVQASMSLGCVPTTSSQIEEVPINLFHKFDGTISKFQSFFNQL